MAGTCEYGKEPSVSIKMRVISWLAAKTGQLLEKDSAPWSRCQTLSAIRPGSPQWYQTGVLSASISFLERGRSHRVQNQGSWAGDDSHLCLARNCWMKTEV
jgi:hypothetical protein